MAINLSVRCQWTASWITAGKWLAVGIKTNGVAVLYVNQVSIWNPFSMADFCNASATCQKCNSQGLQCKWCDNKCKETEDSCNTSQVSLTCYCLWWLKCMRIIIMIRQIDIAAVKLQDVTGVVSQLFLLLSLLHLALHNNK